MNNPTNTAIAKLTAALASLAGNVRFVGVTYRSKESGELARHTLVIGASYRNAIVSSMEELTRKLPTLTDALDIQAANECIASYSKSLLALDAGVPHPGNTKPELYETICPGLRVHKVDGSFELCGLTVAKKVIEQGVHKHVNSKPLTLAKKALQKGLPASKYRTLSVDAGVMESVRIGGSEIEVS